MNENSEPTCPEDAEPASVHTEVSQPEPRLTTPTPHWARRFLACNPFYLLSAALLLYALYLVSIDRNFLSTESGQLFFNFTALQCYEWLLVGTAILLARRAIWYDSTMLVGLENGLVLVPFILVSHAALIEQRWVWGFCFVGAGLAVARVGTLRRFISQLNLPPRLLDCGALMLGVNVAWPIVYRALHENKWGTKPDWGPAFEVNQWCWWLVLPGLCACANLVPLARPKGGLLPQRRWLPMGLFALWLTASAVHLYSLGYVYDFDLRPALVAPALWALAWTLHRRLAEVFAGPQVWTARTALAGPFAASLVALWPQRELTFLVLAMLNAAAYGVVFVRRRDERLALYLAFASVIAMIASLPQEWTRPVTPDMSGGARLVTGVAVCLLLLAVRSRDPRLGAVGAIVSFGTTMLALGNRAGAPHWAAQVAMVFLLLHSLRWEDARHTGARVVRASAAAGWVIAAFLWLPNGGSAVNLALIGALVLAACLVALKLTRDQAKAVIALAAGVVMMSGPLRFTSIKLLTAPAGVLALLASFALFAMGTILALSKHRWHHGR